MTNKNFSLPAQTRRQVSVGLYDQDRSPTTKTTAQALGTKVSLFLFMSTKESRNCQEVSWSERCLHVPSVNLIVMHTESTIPIKQRIVPSICDYNRKLCNNWYSKQKEQRVTCAKSFITYHSVLWHNHHQQGQQQQQQKQHCRDRRCRSSLRYM